MADPLPNRRSDWETITVDNGQCEDPRCPFCARLFLRWWKKRETSMQAHQRGQTVSFSEAAATSVKAP